MDMTEVLDMIAVINELENISEVEVTIGEATLKVTKGLSEAPALPGFAPAASAPPAPAPAQAFSNQASPKQVKYALDLANKLGNGNLGSVVHGLAHSLGVTTEEVIHPDNWAAEMTIDHAAQYLDILERQYNKSKKGAWG